MMKIFTHLIVLAFCGSGCTAPLLDAAKGKPISIDPADVQLQTKSAQIVEVLHPPNSSPWKSTYINICLSKVTRGKAVSYHSINLSYPHYGLDSFTYKDRGGVLVYTPWGNNIISGCDPEKYHRNIDSKNTITLTKLPILEVSEDKPLALNAKENEAVYVSYEKETIKSVGFISLRPIFVKRNNFNIDLTKTVLYTEQKGQKPYLLLLTPLTAVADVITGTVLFGAIAATCGAHSTGCK